MTEPKPAEQYDAGEEFALLDAIRAELVQSVHHTDEALRLLAEWEAQSEYEPALNPLIDRAFTTQDNGEVIFKRPEVQAAFEEIEAKHGPLIDWPIPGGEEQGE